jgi:hypothetical protein
MIENICSMFKLLKFVFWYLLAATTVLYVLPRTALYLQTQYESLNSSTRLLLLLAMMVVIVAGLISVIRSRNGVGQLNRLDHQAHPE